MEVSREEMLEFAKQATFSLDDRLVPYDRETLRAEAWLTGYEFAKRFGMKKQEEEEASAPVEPPVCGDMVIIYSPALTGEVPVVAWWYGVNDSETREPFYYFISIYGDKISYPANKIQIEKALPDYIADSVKRRLEAMIDADVAVASGNK